MATAEMCHLSSPTATSLVSKVAIFHWLYPPVSVPSLARDLSSEDLYKGFSLPYPVTPFPWLVLTPSPSCSLNATTLDILSLSPQPNVCAHYSLSILYCFFVILITIQNHVFICMLCPGQCTQCTSLDVANNKHPIDVCGEKIKYISREVGHDDPVRGSRGSLSEASLTLQNQRKSASTINKTLARLCAERAESLRSR